MDAVVGTEEQRAVDVRQPVRAGRGGTGVDVRDGDGSGLSAVALPQLGAVAAVVGSEEQRAAHVRQVVGVGCGGAGVDVTDEGAAGGGAVALPQLVAAVAVVGREEQRAVHIRQVGRVGAVVSGLDVLDDLTEIKVGIKYLHDGTEIPYFPADLKVLENVQVEYVSMKGWKTKTSQCTVYAQLPLEARDYVEFIERHLAVKIEWVGVGPGRDRMLTR